MRKLFDNFPRVDNRSATPRDRDYEYLNQTARPAFALVRDTLERWLSEYPATDQSELVSRFRSPETITHRGAFFELYCHALLRAYGFQVETHPVLDGKGRPDFLVLEDGKPVFYLEATNVMPSSEQRAGSARDGMIDDCIARLGLQRFYVSKSLRCVGMRSPSLSKIKRFLLSKAASLNPDDDSVRHLRFEYREDDWVIDFGFFPKAATRRAGGAGTSLGITTGPVCYPTPEKGIISSLKKKGGKYGVLELPLVIAINCLHEYVEDDDIESALYGAKANDLEESFWFDRGEAKHTRVSAVLVSVQLVPWTIGSVDTCLWKNPCASRPLHRSNWLGNQIDWYKQSRLSERTKGLSAQQSLGTNVVSDVIRVDRVR